MSLAAARLAVCKHGTVVAFYDVLYQTESTFVVHFLLLAVGTVNHVECEGAGLLGSLLRVG